MFDISAANQNQGNKCIFRSFGPKRVVVHLAACIDNNVK